jgi:ribosomal protein S18 acetylase RimI-like enzyme
LLALFDQQVRRRPEADGSSGVEHAAGVIRQVAPAGWSGVVCSDLDEASADAVIAREIERFSRLRGRWEWKHYSYDQPPDLPARLRAAGLRPEPEEALLVAEIAALDLSVHAPAGVSVTDVCERAQVQALGAVEQEVFGVPGPTSGEQLLSAITARPPRSAAALALADERPVAAGRIDFYAGSEFAVLFGGCTLPAFRRRGIYRALVAARARVAAAHGFRYLQVDASSDSEPILRRLGFVEIGRTTPYIPRAG